jgi:hypothetical protein
MPRKSARKQKQRKNVKQTVKKGGMMKALTRLTSRKTYEEKLYDEIFDLLKYTKPKKDAEKKLLANFILKKNEKKNSKNPNYKFKSELYKISDKISMLEVTNPNKLTLLSTLEKTLNKFLGKYTSSVMAKLSAPSLQSSRNNVDLADAFADLDLSHSRSVHNNALRSVNSRLRRTNLATAAFLHPRSLTTTTKNNGWEEVTHPGATNVNQSEVNKLMEEARAETLYNSMPRVPTGKPTAKGGNRNIKKSRKSKKRVYS